MSQDSRDILEVLTFELSFLEDGGYGRSSRAPWHAPAIFEDSRFAWRAQIWSLK